MTETEVIDELETLRKEGSLARDTGTANPYPVGTLASYMHATGWVRRDLQLGLARARPSYRKFQIVAGSITEEGIRGGYGFDNSNPFVEG